jgi:hypothetical protein
MVLSSSFPFSSPFLPPLSPCCSLNMSRKEVISLLSDDSSNNPGNDANKEMDVNVEIPPNTPIIETIVNIPVANDPITFWTNVSYNFVAENNITLSFTIRGAPVAFRRPSVRRDYGASIHSNFLRQQPCTKQSWFANQEL